jgi:hypothetical protein
MSCNLQGLPVIWGFVSGELYQPRNSFQLFDKDGFRLGQGNREDGSIKEELM